MVQHGWRGGSREGIAHARVERRGVMDAFVAKPLRAKREVEPNLRELEPDRGLAQAVSSL